MSSRNCRSFPDALAVARYPIDIHRPNDNGCTLEWCGDCYDIPYSSLVPQKIDRLLVAGRCISATHEAMAAIRVMGVARECRCQSAARGAAGQRGISAELELAALKGPLRAGKPALRVSGD